MNEQTQQPPNDQVRDEKPEEVRPLTPPEQTYVQLTPEQYEALLDKIEELERRPEPRQQPKSVDDLAEETRRRPMAPQPGQQIDLDQLTNTQLAQYIVDEVNRQAGQIVAPIVQDLEEVKLLREIEKAESKYPDFWDYKDQIHNLGRTQPHLSIEQAYLIASGQRKGETKDTKSSDKRSAVITGLPPRPSYSGEKPSGTVPPRLAEKPASTIKEAADKAWDEVVGKDKTNV